MLPATLNAFYPKLLEKPEIVPILQQIYAPNLDETDHLGWFKALTHMATGGMFTGFTGREADYYVWNGNKNVYMYEFTWPTSLSPFIIGG